MPNPFDEPGFLERFRLGDRAALGRVYAHFAAELGRSLSRGFGFECRGSRLRFDGIRDPFALDDLVQETFIRAFGEKPRQTYDGARSYLGYLVGIARNLIIDQFRSQSRWAAWVRAADEAEAGRAGAPSPERMAMESQLRDLVDRFLDGLTQRDRQVWTLRFEEGLSRRAIEEKTGLSAMQLRTLERKLRDRLFKMLAGAGYVPAQLVWIGLLFCVIGTRLHGMRPGPGGWLDLP